jgi:TolA-binding protein
MTDDRHGSNDQTPEATPGASSATTTNGSNKRKRGAAAASAATSSSRGVANLTAEQLERKRANDREAQRAIRERTKQQIERLNERIRELESSQPYRDLQAVISQKEAVQQENEDIKRQLASFVAVFQRYLAVPSGLEGMLELSSLWEGSSLMLYRARRRR